MSQRGGMKVAIQGELGSFSHEAASHLVVGAEILPCSTAEQVLRALSDAQCDAAVIPIENSLAGSVIDFYNIFFQHEFAIEREMEMRIRHNLIASESTDLSSIRRVFSHPVALAQCRQFFADHPGIEAAPFYDTAGSVRHIVSEKNPEWAAIASKHAAGQYGAKILMESIEDRNESYTRFWLIRRRANAIAPERPTKMSLVFLLENRPGSLLEALGAFAARNLNLTKIESRPVAAAPWEYMFYADVAVPGHAEADAVIQDLETICSTVKELGRYDTLIPASK
jgi:prephenate dehydratase